MKCVSEVGLIKDERQPPPVMIQHLPSSRRSESGKNQEENENEDETSFSNNKIGLSKKPSIKDVNEGRTWKEDQVGSIRPYNDEREIDVEQQLKAFEKKKPSGNDVEFSSDKDEDLPENVSDIEENPHTMQGFEGRGHSRKTSNIVIVDEENKNLNNSRDEAKSDEEPKLSKRNSQNNGQVLDLHAGKPERKKMMQGTAPKIMVKSPQKGDGNPEDNRKTVDQFGGTDFNINPPDTDTPGFFEIGRQGTPKKEHNVWNGFHNDKSFDDSSFTKNSNPSIDQGWNGFPGVPEENLPSKIKGEETQKNDPFGAAFKKKKNTTPKIVGAFGTPKKPEDRLSFKKKTGDSFAISQNEDLPDKESDPLDSERKISKKGGSNSQNGNDSIKRLASISDNEHNQEDVSVVECFHFDEFDSNSMSNISNIETVKAGEEKPKKSAFDFEAKTKLSQSTPSQKEEVSKDQSSIKDKDIEVNPLLQQQNQIKNSENSRKKFSDDSDLMSGEIIDNISPIGDSNDFSKGFDNYNIAQKEKEKVVGATDEHDIDLLSEDQNMSDCENKIPSPKEVKIGKGSSLGQLDNEEEQQYKIKINNETPDSMRNKKSNSQKEIMPKIPEFDRSNTDDTQRVTISKERITTTEQEFNGANTLTKKPKVVIEEKITKTVEKVNREPKVVEVSQRKESIVGAIEKEHYKTKQMSQEESELENMFLESFNAEKSEIEILENELEGTPLGKRGDMNTFLNLFADGE